VRTPSDEAELVARARALAGRSLEGLAREHGVTLGSVGRSTKGKTGTLLERVLGATGGSSATWDFPSLGVELKTVPVDLRGVPRESTFVCTISLRDADRAEWATSWARAKLRRVLWVPVLVLPDGSRRVAGALLWSPTAAQDVVLAQDFEDIMGRIGAGEVEGLSGHAGRWLQVRPKAAHGRVRTAAPARDGGLLATVPRGFYLRALFTGALLRDPVALPGRREGESSAG